MTGLIIESGVILLLALSTASPSIISARELRLATAVRLPSATKRHCVSSTVCSMRLDDGSQPSALGERPDITQSPGLHCRSSDSKSASTSSYEGGPPHRDIHESRYCVGHLLR